MSGTRKNPSPHPVGRAAAFGAALAVSTQLLAGCGSGGGSSQNVEQLLLTAPNTDIAVTIPTGWHQVIDSTNPSTAEMVFPTTCMGNAEVTCATGLARLATFAAPSAEAAAQTVQRAVSTAPGVRAASITSQGPGKVGQRDGHRLRFTFANASAKLVSEIAAVPTGSPIPDAQGNHEFSIVLVWVSDAPSAPRQGTIDQIIGSALFVGGHP
ncbi:MAG TPA: hypothetical protein VHY21_21355 [Pseudonocardiaceae bacterium]|nr:hypothetical protein [Pseudonocardiaceae bacterium]